MTTQMVTSATGASLQELAERSWERTAAGSELYYSGQRWTGEQLADRSRRLSGGLREAGLRPGERVVICMANCPEVSISYHAIWRAGAVATPVLFLLSEDELRHVLSDSGAVLAITTPEFLPRVAAAAAGLPGVRGIVVAGEAGGSPAGGAAGSPGAGSPGAGSPGAGSPGAGSPGAGSPGAGSPGAGSPGAGSPGAGSPGAGSPGAGSPGAGSALPLLPFAELEAADPAGLVGSDPAALAALLYTGGTTGRSKGVMISHDALSASAWAATATSHDPALTAALLPLPLSHVYGLMVSVMSLHTPDPGTTVLMRWFDPAGWLALAQQHRVNISPLVPSMLQMLLGQPLEDYDLSALARLTSGAAPLPGQVAADFARRLPHVEVAEGYGCTETAAIIATSPLGEARRGSVGRPAPGVQVRIELPDGSEAAPGQDGEVCVRGPVLMSGYWNAAAETERALRGGWLHTGDVGRLDDGYLYIVDRIKDLIIRGGYNVYPRDVEDVLVSHPDVAAAAVVGRPDPRYGEEVVAFVELRDGARASAADLVAFARQHLSAVKYPREVRVIERIPLTSVLKTDRKRLRAQLAAE